MNIYTRFAVYRARRRVLLQRSYWTEERRRTSRLH